MLPLSLDLACSRHFRIFTDLSLACRLSGHLFLPDISSSRHPCPMMTLSLNLACAGHLWFLTASFLLTAQEPGTWHTLLSWQISFPIPSLSYFLQLPTLVAQTPRRREPLYARKHRVSWDFQHPNITWTWTKRWKQPFPCKCKPGSPNTSAWNLSRSPLQLTMGTTRAQHEHKPNPTQTAAHHLSLSLSLHFCLSTFLLSPSLISPHSYSHLLLLWSCICCNLLLWLCTVVVIIYCCDYLLVICFICCDYLLLWWCLVPLNFLWPTSHHSPVIVALYSHQFPGIVPLIPVTMPNTLVSAFRNEAFPMNSH